MGEKPRPADGGVDAKATEVLRGPVVVTPNGGLDDRTQVEPLLESPGETMPPDDLGVSLDATHVSNAPVSDSETTEDPQGEPSQPTVETLASGLKVNQYELIRELGRGGMGTVYLARDTKLGRKVAIKFLRTTSKSFTQRFLVEARATARCNHENIVVIYEVSEYDGLPYMVLEYLEGEPLASVFVEGRPLPVQRAVELMVPVLKALARAHEFNIVHRDLKPENIQFTGSGLVKVLDFGIAKLYEPDEKSPGNVARTLPPINDLGELGTSKGLTKSGALVGTVTYMAPEQWGVGTVDVRADIWAVGVMLYEMVAGQNPLAKMSPQQLMANAVQLGKPLPSVGDVVPELPSALETIIDRCLAKQPRDRYQSAAELLEELEPQLPGRYSRKLADDESPFPGLKAFQESDAGRFFGRSRDVLRSAARIRDTPLSCLAGASGVGKSSFVRAGLVPTLKRSGEAWEVFITRPGRQPLAGLASLLQPLTRSSTTDLVNAIEEQTKLQQRLRDEPGYLGTMLRSRARQKNGSVLLFVDQFEELYTLVGDEERRNAYVACLAGAADDAAAPVRVVVSMRSDFLDRAAENPQFMDDLTRGLLFLQAPDHQGLREALTLPVEMADHRFESEDMVEEMLGALAGTHGALPLLQFAAVKLWEARDRSKKLLTRQAYDAMGGIGGALASHANDVLADFGAPAQKLVRAIFQRLVTPESTRAIVDVQELLELAPDPGEVQRIIDRLVSARLLVVQSRSDEEGPAVEIVHESLISTWPTLRRWLDESQEDAAFLEQLRTATRQWTARGRPQGLLWRGEAMEEARRFRRRYKEPLPKQETEYLREVLELADRAVRFKRRLVAGTIAFLLVLVAAAAVALFWIRQAERDANRQADIARKQSDRARSEATAALRARSQALEAKAQISRQLELLQKAKRAKHAALSQASAARAKAATEVKKAKTAKKLLNMSKKELQDALTKARLARTRAEAASRRALEAAAKVRKAAEAERKAKQKLQRLLAAQRAAYRKLQRQRKKIATELR